MSDDLLAKIRGIVHQVERGEHSALLGFSAIRELVRDAPIAPPAPACECPFWELL